MAAAIEATITTHAVRKRSQTGKPTWRRTALKPEVVADPTFSKLEVIAEPAFWMTVGSSAVASAASRPSHSWVGAETT